jgi:hypothetical protein
MSCCIYEKPLLISCTCLASVVQEDSFDIFTEYAGDLKSQAQPWLVFARLHRVDALPRYADGIGKLSLRPLFFSSQDAKSKEVFSGRYGKGRESHFGQRGRQRLRSLLSLSERWPNFSLSTMRDPWL